MVLGSAAGAPPGGERFPNSLRLRRRKEFLRVQRQGIKVSTDPLLALALKNSRGVTRLGITISSKVGNAVVRNRIRRRLREIFRRHRELLPRGIDLVLIATPQATAVGFSELSGAYCQLADKLRRRFQ
jgi:ribonuclease P protein component